MNVTTGTTKTPTGGNRMTYYVIEVNYVGPNDLGDVDTIGIYTSPACGRDGEPVVDGWARTINNRSTYGRGAYHTIDEARARIDGLYPERRAYNDDDYYDYEDIVELYRPGKYAQMTRGDTRDWMLADRCLTGDETDDELRAIVEMAESSANDNGCTLHCSAFDILVEECEWRKQEASKMLNNSIIEVSELIDWGWEDDWYADMLPDLDPDDFGSEEEMEEYDHERRRQYWLLEGWVATSQEAYEAVLEWMGVKYNDEFRAGANEIVRRFRDNATDKYWPINCVLSYVLDDNYDLDPPNNIAGSGTYNITYF